MSRSARSSMFCPKCGAENPETNQYCRACRENLQVISQAMKSRLPVVIASKLDQILDSRSERFRRDSILALVWSLTVVLGGLASWLKGYSGYFSSPSIFLPMALLLAMGGLLEYAAYRRSLSTDFHWAEPNQEHKGLTSEVTISGGLARSPASHNDSTDIATQGRYLAKESPPSVTESTTRQLDPSSKKSETPSNIIYCPKCGRTSDQTARRCLDCGANLNVIAKALEPQEQKWLTTKLDRHIRKRNNEMDGATQKSTLALVMPCIWLLQGVLMIAYREPGWWVYLPMAFSFLVTTVWDRAYHHRNSSEQGPTVQMADATPPTIGQDCEVFSQDGRVLRINDANPPTIDTAESKPIREWQQLYPDLWMLIGVTREDESGVSEGKLIATAEDHNEFRELDMSYSDR